MPSDHDANEVVGKYVGGGSLALFVALLASCAHPTAEMKDFECGTGRTISASEAIDIMVRAKRISKRDDYEISVDQDKLGYLVGFSAKDESAVPSDGTVVVNYCGDVEAIIAPL